MGSFPDFGNVIIMASRSSFEKVFEFAAWLNNLARYGIKVSLKAE